MGLADKARDLAGKATDKAEEMDAAGKLDGVKGKAEQATEGTVDKAEDRTGHQAPSQVDDTVAKIDGKEG